MHKKMATLLRYPVLFFDVEMIKCDSCARVFFGRPCFDRHRTQRSHNQSLSSVCESIKICNGCGRLINSKSRHDCDVIYCKTCRSLQSSNHLCYMRPLCRKATVGNPGEGISTMALREENLQTNTNDVEDTNERVKRDASHSCFMISKRDKMKRSKERRT